MRRFKDALYLVTDMTDLTKDEFLFKISEALRAGVDIVQIREKEKSAREIIELGKVVKEMTDRYNVPLIIDDRVDVAYHLSCGVHLGDSDIPIKTARKILGSKKIIGASAKSVEAAIEKQKDGADYLGVGAIRPTKTKVITKLTDISTLKSITENVDIDVFAIGGLDISNLEILKGIDISGICVVRAIMRSSDSYEKTKLLKTKIQLLNARN